MNIVGVRFNQAGKIYDFKVEDPIVTQIGDKVIVETIRGLELGVVMRVCGHECDCSCNTNNDKPIKPIIRLATQQDLDKAEENKIKEQEAFKIATEKIEQHKLKMKLIDVEYTFDGSKILFYFTAEGRVDFRELVKSLAVAFRSRIELRQIGVRDEAKHMNGIGICGRQLCCSSHISDFQTVSIKMAKEQGLSLSPTKISGSCGRLMCCLQYEQETYEEMLSITPSVGSIVSTVDGEGVVTDANVLKNLINVKLHSGDETCVKTYKGIDVKVIKAAPRSTDDVQDIPNELER